MGSLEQTNQKFQNDNWHDDKLTNQLRDTIALNKDDTFWWHFWQKQTELMTGPAFAFSVFPTKNWKFKGDKIRNGNCTNR
jgi:hypothetical protein